MNSLGLLVPEPWVQRLGWVLIHFLWQGMAIALLLAVGLRLLARASSHVRYAVIGSALLLCGIMPVATWMVLDSYAQPVASPVLTANSVTVPEVVSATTLKPHSLDEPIELPGGFPRRWQESLARVAELALPYVVGVWFAGVVVLTVRLSLIWVLMRRLCFSALPIRDALCLERFQRLLERMRIAVPVRLLESALVEVPTLIGWLRPTILVPTSVVTGLTPEQLEAILAHELAHVRRYDYLVNLLQTVIETILFYHPAVWWIGRKLREERENCCDDIALEVMQDRLVYASALAQLEEGRGLPLALTASGGLLLRRIRRIAGANDRKVSAWPLWVLIVGILAVVCLTKSKATEAAASSAATSTSAPNAAASTVNIEVGFTLVQIDEKTYQQQTAAIDDAVKNGDVLFFHKLGGASVLASPRVTTRAGLKANISMGKELIQGDKSTPNTTYTATSVLDANGKLVPTVVKSQTMGPTKSFLGMDFEATPSLSKDGAVLLRTRYRVGYVPEYKSPSDFVTRSTAANKDVSIVDGKTAGFFTGYEDPSAGNRYAYSLFDILKVPDDEITTVPPLTPSPNRLVLIVSARHIARDASATKGDPTALLTAVNARDFDSVNALLQQGVDPNAKGQWGAKQDLVARPIAWAISDGNLEMAQLLLDHGAKADDYVPYALNMGDAKMVKLFWDHGVKSISELSYQISQGAPIDILKRLLSQDSAAKPSQDMVMTPLAVASAFGNKPALDLLLAHGTDPNKCGVFAQDTWARPDRSPPSDLLLPLSVAAENGHDEIVADLLSHGVRPTQEAMLLAVERSSVSLDWERQRVHFENAIRLLIDAGVLKNIPSDEAGKILFSSIYYGGNPNPVVLKMLLDAGLSPQLKCVDTQSKSLIDYVREDYKRYEQAVPTRAAWIKPSLDILEAAQKRNQDTGADEAAFHQALERDRMLVADSSVQTSTLKADAEMLLAIQKGDPTALKIVLEHAVDPNTFDPDRFGNTPLYWAVYFNQPECLKLLLDHFAMDDGPTHRSDGVASVLARKSHPELVPILQEGLIRNEATLTTRLKERLHSIRIDLPAFSNAPIEQITHFLLDATAKAGYLERRVTVGRINLPASTTITSSEAKKVTIWDALQTITSANNLRFDVSDNDVGTVMFYRPEDENMVHPASTKKEIPAKAL